MNKDILKSLEQYKKIIVTGPIRSGTTISAYIVANELNYEFIDESVYNHCEHNKFFFLLNNVKENLVIHNVLFINKLYLLNDYFNLNDICVILVKRDIKDIVESFKHTRNLEITYLYRFSDKQFSENLERFDPDKIYEQFYKNKIDNLIELKYPEDIQDSKYFIDKKYRRKYFTHTKQIRIKNNEEEFIRKIAFV